MAQTKHIPSSVLFVKDDSKTYRLAQADEVLVAAQELLLSKVRERDVLSSPEAVRAYLKARLSTLEHEVFAVMHLDAQNCLIDYVEMFRGTLTQTSVYPREVVKEAILRNSASMILVHNHPSGCAQPSRADEALTHTLKAALCLVDVRVLDHMIVAGADVTSMAEQGLL